MLSAPGPATSKGAMKTFLLSLILTLAVAASLIVIVDRFQGAGADSAARLAAIERKLADLERAVVVPPAKPAGSNHDPERGAEDRPPSPPGTKTLADAIKLLEEIEGMILDAERGLRRDLTGVYEKLLARIDEAAIKGGVPQDPAEARKALREKVAQMGVTVLEDEGLIELKGEISEANRALELLMVAPGGRVFESLVLVDVVPSALKIAMEDMGWVESDPDPQTWTWSESASGAYVYVLWEDLKKPRRIEDLVFNRATNDCMARTKFMFTASRMFTDPRTFDRHFIADLYKGVISLTFNYTADCILACPLPDAANENIWFPHPTAAPKPGTKLKVFITREPRPVWDKI